MTSSGTIPRVDSLSRADWSRLLASFDDATLYQSWDYPAIVFPSQSSSRLALFSGDAPLALAQARLATFPLLGGIAYVAWGPVWQKSGAPADPSSLAAVLSALKDEYARRRGLLLRIMPNIVDSDSSALRALEAAGFARTDAAPYRTMLVDLTPSLDEIRKAFAQKWRNCLNRAERNGLDLSEGASSPLYSEFLTMYDRMLARKSFDTGLSPHQWAALQAALPDAEKLRVLVARKDGVPVASMVFSTLGRKGIYFLGATSDDGLKLQGSYLLQWRAISIMKEAGCTLYDLGGIDPDRNPGVFHFKSGLGGRDSSHLGAWEYCESARSRMAVSLGETLRRLKSSFQRPTHAQ